MKKKKKKIALIVDADNWAFANIAKNISFYLSTYYDFKIIPTSYLDDNLAKTLILADECDLLHFFWRGKLLALDYYEFESYINSLGTDIDTFKEVYWNNKLVTTAVYDHLYSINEDDLKITNQILDKCYKYYVSSNKLLKVYENLNVIKKPECVITDGVSLEMFYPQNLKRFTNIKNRPLIVGWSGNSAWEQDKEDFKGVNTILIPTIKELQKEGYNIEMNFADRQIKMIPHDKMRDYYNSIDVYICTSKMEGTPNPILESMACGVPIISTDVGIVNDVLGPQQKKYLLEKRTKECLKKKIIMFINNLDNIKVLSNENLEYIKNWTWEKVSYKMKKFFDSVLEGNEK